MKKYLIVRLLILLLILNQFNLTAYGQTDHVKSKFNEAIQWILFFPTIIFSDIQAKDVEKKKLQILNKALKLNKPDLCNNLPVKLDGFSYTITPQQDCYSTYNSIKNLDIKGCLKINDYSRTKEAFNCFDAIFTENMSYHICDFIQEKMPKEKESYYFFNRKTRSNDLWFKNVYTECYTRYANKFNEVNVCKQIKDNDQRLFCQLGVKEKNNFTSSDCNSLKDSYNNQFCYRLF